MLTGDSVKVNLSTMTTSACAQITPEAPESHPVNCSSILQRYCTLTKRLGGGSQGEVWLANGHVANVHYAVKMLPATREAWDEIKAYQLIGIHEHHRHLLQAKLLIAEDRCVNLLLEACDKDLLEYVQKSPSGVPEPLARRWSRQLCGATVHLHEMGLMHLDIKLENILLNHTGGDIEMSDIKLTDFGLSAFGAPGQTLSKLCGSGIYRAPEVSLTAKYGPYDGRKADVWSLGVCIFVLMRGCFPFAAHVPIERLELYMEPADGVRRTPLPMIYSPIQRSRLPPSLLELLAVALAVDPACRPLTSEMLEAEWLHCGGDVEYASDDTVGTDPDSDSGYATPPASRRPPRCPPYLIDVRRKRRRRSQSFDKSGLHECNE